MSGLNANGLNDHWSKVVADTFNMLNIEGNARIILQGDEEQGLLTSLAAARVNIFGKNIDLLNIIEANGVILLQLKRTEDVHSAKYGGVADTNNYRLFAIGYKELSGDNGILRIEPGDKSEHVFTKLLKHIFPSDIVDVDHPRFNRKYELHASDKKIANTIMTDTVLDVISDHPNLYISIMHDKLVIVTPELNTNAVAAIMKICRLF